MHRTRSPKRRVQRRTRTGAVKPLDADDGARCTRRHSHCSVEDDAPHCGLSIDKPGANRYTRQVSRLSIRPTALVSIPHVPQPQNNPRLLPHDCYNQPLLSNSVSVSARLGLHACLPVRSSTVVYREPRRLPAKRRLKRSHAYTMKYEKYELLLTTRPTSPKKFTKIQLFFISRLL